MRLSVLSFLFIFATHSSYSQGAGNERSHINAYTIEANKLIWHINLNIKYLASFQEEMNAWYESNSTSLNKAPIFSYSPYEISETFVHLSESSLVKPSNPAFNYKNTLANLNKQIILFNSFCKQLKGLSRTGSKEEYYKKSMAILYQMDSMAPEMVNLCYDFSLSCAINYGKEKLPTELNQLKNTVGQAKNVIMAIRENDPIQVKSYLNQLDLSIASGMGVKNFNELKRAGRFLVEDEDLVQMYQQILSAANQIAFWAEQYLQSNFSESEVAPILKSAIIAFNVREGQVGCSGAYNELLGYSKNEYLYFTEEPMFFEVQETEREEEFQATIEVIQDTVIIQNIVTEPIVKVESPEEVDNPVVFDVNDITTLDGSLPNNIIIMMDVSASMKLTGKLPLLKSSILHLVDIMRPEDRLSLIAYSGSANVLIANASVSDKMAIKAVLDTLHSSGGTDIKNGLSLGYETAMSSYMEDGNNRIIIATDGEFGVREDLIELIQSKYIHDVFVSVFQYNEIKQNDQNETMKNLAVIGRGSYQTITNSEEALQVLMKEVKKN